MSQTFLNDFSVYIKYHKERFPVFVTKRITKFKLEKAPCFVHRITRIFRINDIVCFMFEVFTVLNMKVLLSGMLTLSDGEIYRRFEGTCCLLL